MTNQFTELQLIEQTAIQIFQNLWWKDSFIDAFTKQWEQKLWRKNRGEVVLTKHLKPKLTKLNPNLPQTTINKAIEKFLEDKSILTPEKANKQIYNQLKDGITINNIDENGNEEIVKVKAIDLENPENNHFMLVSQMWITWETYTRRPDLIGFINRIPNNLYRTQMSMKKPKRRILQKHPRLQRHYPQVFWYNAFIIISNWIDNKIWSLTSGFEHFSDWKKIKDKKKNPK